MEANEKKTATWKREEVAAQPHDPHRVTFHTRGVILSPKYTSRRTD